ncbi:hypothetical protein GGR36_001014 [Niveibacterium umoris]|uniref:Uncharacterized protein n=1 Tax=Niveibacterium umoris TaxID=1193620 RepID=A0A840BLD6_9RHOO|nr:hypothetical protein [Niveibacterium umoris]
MNTTSIQHAAKANISIEKDMFETYPARRQPCARFAR